METNLRTIANGRAERKGQFALWLISGLDLRRWPQAMGTPGNDQVVGTEQHHVTAGFNCPKHNHWLINEPICFGGKFTTATTRRPSKTCGVYRAVICALF